MAFVSLFKNCKKVFGNGFSSGGNPKQSTKNRILSANRQRIAFYIKRVQKKRPPFFFHGKRLFFSPSAGHRCCYPEWGDREKRGAISPPFFSSSLGGPSIPSRLGYWRRGRGYPTVSQISRDIARDCVRSLNTISHHEQSRAAGRGLTENSLLPEKLRNWTTVVASSLKIEIS